ncbi:hypothetical protein V8E36_003436 [Tilletia maclaganii]
MRPGTILDRELWLFFDLHSQSEMNGLIRSQSLTDASVTRSNDRHSTVFDTTSAKGPINEAWGSRPKFIGTRRSWFDRDVQKQERFTKYRVDWLSVSGHHLMENLHGSAEAPFADFGETAFCRSLKVFLTREVSLATGENAVGSGRHSRAMKWRTTKPKPHHDRSAQQQLQHPPRQDRPRTPSHTFQKPQQAQGQKSGFLQRNGSAARKDAGDADEDDDRKPGASKDADQDSLLDDDEMLAEIEALGGDASDLELIKGAGKPSASAAQVEDDPNLKSDIKNFIAQLKLPSIAPDEPEAEAQSSNAIEVQAVTVKTETGKGKERDAGTPVAEKMDKKGKTQKPTEAVDNGNKQKIAKIEERLQEASVIREENPAANVIFQPAAPSLQRRVGAAC